MNHITPQHLRPTYDCPELRRDPGIPAERYRAFDLPSRIGDMLYYPDGRVEPVNHAQLPA